METQRNRYAVYWFLGLTFGLTWLLWSPLWLTGITENKLLATLVMAPGMWVPGLCAFWVVRFRLHESIRTTTVDRLGRKRYYLWAWLLPLAGTVASMLLTVAFGVARFDSDFTKLREMAEASGRPLPAAPAIIAVAQAALALTFGPLFNVLFTVGEEIGWRGFLLPRLMRAGLRQWPALVVSGVIWGLWHAPVIALGHNYPDHPYVGVLLMTVFCTLVGIIFGWLQLASGSVWVPALAHGSINAVAGLPIVLLTPHDSVLGGMLTSVIGWLPMVGFIAWLACSGRLPVAEGKEEVSAPAALAGINSVP